MGSKTFTSNNNTGTVAFENPHYGEPNTGVKVNQYFLSKSERTFIKLVTESFAVISVQI